MREKKTQTKCVGCKFAEWKRTAAGRLHPDCDGKCRHPLFSVPPVVPASATVGYWSGGDVKLSGGYIYRYDTRSLNECKTFEQEARDDG